MPGTIVTAVAARSWRSIRGRLRDFERRLRRPGSSAAASWEEAIQTIFDSGPLPAAERHQAWRDATGEIHLAVDCAADRPTDRVRHPSAIVALRYFAIIALRSQAKSMRSRASRITDKVLAFDNQKWA